LKEVRGQKGCREDRKKRRGGVQGGGRRRRKWGAGNKLKEGLDRQVGKRRTDETEKKRNQLKGAKKECKKRRQKRTVRGSHYKGRKVGFKKKWSIASHTCT